MAGHDDNYGLTIPPQRPCNGDGPELRPRKLAEWLADLPLANVSDSARRVQDYLDRVNGCQVPAGTRVKLLEAIAEPGRFLAAALNKTLAARGLPLTERSLAAADQLTGLLTAQACGYKIVTAEILSGRARYDRKLLSQAIHGAMDRLSRILLVCYRLYTPPPRTLWLELNLLYYFATVHDAAGAIARGHDMTTACMYKATVLLTMADPYRLRQGEADLLWNRLARWSEAVTLRPAETAVGLDSSSVFCHLNLDVPPGATVANGARDLRYCRYVDLERLNPRLQQLIAGSEAAQTGEISHDLLQRVLSAWERRAQRAYSRLPQATPIDLAIGLETAYHVMHGTDAGAAAGDANGADHLPDPPALDPLIDTHTEFSIAPLPSQLAHYQKTWKGTVPSTIRTVGEHGRDDEPVELLRNQRHIQAWETVNVSAEGYCLTQHEPLASTAQVGELVGLRETDREAGDWCLGVVRWLQCDRALGVKAGVQILAPVAEAVTARATRGRPDQRRPFKCLKLRPIAALSQPPTLLIPATRHRAGDTLIVGDEENPGRVRLTRLVEGTGNFARYQYEPVGDDVTPASLRESGSGDSRPDLRH
ncbi:MAG: hypothetical protein P8076_00240 [Gammaproteobacteria bacterium]